MGTQLVWRSAIGLSLVVLVGCGGGSSGGPAGPSPVGPATTLVSVEVSGGEGLEVGTKTQMKALGKYSDGSSKDVTSEVKWASLSQDLATVEPSGVVTGVASGTVTIQATLQSQTGTRRVQVLGRRVYVSITAIGVECAAACDNFLEGPGDFTYRATATAVGTVSEGSTPDARTLSQTSGYPSAAGVIALGNGQSRSLNNKATFAVRLQAGSYIQVDFRATEWDRDLFGKTFADGRMNNDLDTARYTWNPTTGWGTAFGIHTISVGGSGCVLRLRYIIEIATS